jgi:tRNA A-37 threonylcarbamoyl transferase component Bud32
MNYINKVLNAGYTNLDIHINDIPNSFDAIDHIIQNHRNDIRVFEAGGCKLVVKSFKGMYFTNQIAYSLFRKSKAQRSYENSLRLQSKGISVPDPVAFIDCYRFFFLTQSYYISRYHEHTSFNDMLKNEESKENSLSSFAKFTFNLHCAGVYHNDYSNGNILCNDCGDGNLSFHLVDLNRVRFRNVNYSSGVKNISKLHLSKEEFEVLVKRYSELWGRSMRNELIILQKIRMNRNRFSRCRKWAKSIFYSSRIQKKT